MLLLLPCCFSGGGGALFLAPNETKNDNTCICF